MTFYRTPKDIFNPIADRQLCVGSVVNPLAPCEIFHTQLETAGITKIISAPDDQAYLDTDWWRSLPEFDWCVAITQGTSRTIEWIIEPAWELANRGLIILDRLTFLEPTRTRRDFLSEATLSNLIILNPRPEFRNDDLKAKDSVTSAWFVFDKLAKDKQQTKIEYAVSWQRPGSFRSE